MVLEEVLAPTTARKRPFLVFVLSFLFTVIAMWVSYFIFPHSASILTITFIVFATALLIHNIITLEETEEVTRPGSAGTFLERHFDLIKIYGWFFLGVTIAYSLWYVILPASNPTVCIPGTEVCMAFPTRESIFEEQDRQLDAIGRLRQNLASGKFIEMLASNEYWKTVFFLFSNNATVLLLAILFSFLYGFGVLFLISWNASIIGTVIGKTAAGVLPVYGSGLIGSTLAYLHGLWQGLGFIPHGVPEIISYFIGAIAGGIISAAVSKKQYQTKEFEIIAKDAFVLIVIAVVTLWIAAMIEAYILIGNF
ncbi:MAG: stage II sporulation protein M [Candidatus Diapherotrites archaeon]|nr:stage II sporulation protein M [Candidatus Diapherotrites archaeon]